MSVAESIDTIIRLLGSDDVLIQLAEESSELSQSCLKIVRNNGRNKAKVTILKSYDNLHEEIADVLVALRILQEYDLIDMERVEEIADKKLVRWSNRLLGDWEE